MPRLSYHQRQRVFVYKEYSHLSQNNLSWTKAKYSVLKELASNENIFATELTFRRIIKKWYQTGEIKDKPSRIRGIKCTKITRAELAALDNLIFEDRGISLKRAKDVLRLRPTKNTLGKYLKKLGWRKIKSKYCQFVRTKNRIERVLYATMCQSSNLDYNDSIFIDETTRQACKNSPLQWFQTKQEEVLYQNILMNHQYMW